jgi:hypothetical protein
MFAATEPLTAARRARSRSRSRSRSLTSNTPVSKTPVRAASPLGASVSFESAVAEAGLEGAISADVAEAIMESEDLTPAEVEQGTGRVVLGKISSPVLSFLEGALASPRPASAGAAPRSTANVGTRELQKLEENLSRKFEQLMKQEQQRTREYSFSWFLWRVICDLITLVNSQKTCLSVNGCEGELRKLAVKNN